MYHDFSHDILVINRIEINEKDMLLCLKDDFIVGVNVNYIY